MTGTNYSKITKLITKGYTVAEACRKLKTQSYEYYNEKARLQRGSGKNTKMVKSLTIADKKRLMTILERATSALKKFNTDVMKFRKRA